MIRVFLLLGSNEGDRKAILEHACVEIESKAGLIAEKSSIYQTAAWGKEDQQAFLNQIIVIDTLLSADDLLKTVLSIETNLGRIRSEKWGSRTIDIDILYYGNEIINTQALKVPHPRIAERRFTLVPLVEIAGAMKDPVSGKTMSELLEECRDTLDVSSEF